MLSTTLAPGEKEGGTILVVEGQHKLVSGGVTFDNSQNKELGREQPFGAGGGGGGFGAGGGGFGGAAVQLSFHTSLQVKGA